MDKITEERLNDGIADADAVLLLGALQRAIADNAVLSEEADYLAGRVAFHRERSDMMFTEALGVPVTDNPEGATALFIHLPE